MKIRPFRPSECDDWKTMLTGYYSGVDRWDRRIIKANWAHIHDKAHTYKAWAAYDGKTPMGFIAVSEVFYPSFLKPILYINDLYVDPAYRRQGVATALLETIFRKFDKKRHARIEWKTFRTNKKAQSLYNTLAERTGWIIYERHKGL